VNRTGVVALAATCLSLSACVVPARNDAVYRTDASMALESADSETRTAQLALEQWLNGQLTGPYANVVVTDSEGALGPIQTSFGGMDPSSRAVDELRDDVLQQLSDAEDALAAARIALRRNDRAGVKVAASTLDSVAKKLEESGKRVS